MISKRLAVMLGGDITVTSVRGQGQHVPPDGRRRRRRGSESRYFAQQAPTGHRQRQ